MKSFNLLKTSTYAVLFFGQKKGQMFKLSYIRGLGKTTGGKTSIIGYIISQKIFFVKNFFEIFKKGYIY